MSSCTMRGHTTYTIATWLLLITWILMMYLWATAVLMCRRRLYHRMSCLLVQIRLGSRTNGCRSTWRLRRLFKAKIVILIVHLVAVWLMGYILLEFLYRVIRADRCGRVHSLRLLLAAWWCIPRWGPCCCTTIRMHSSLDRWQELLLSYWPRIAVDRTTGTSIDTLRSYRASTFRRCNNLLLYSKR